MTREERQALLFLFLSICLQWQRLGWEMTIGPEGRER